MNLSGAKEEAEVRDEMDLIDWHGCDAVQFDPERLGGRATVGNSRLDADTVLLNYGDGMSVDELHDHFGDDVKLIQKVVEFIEASKTRTSADPAIN